MTIDELIAALESARRGSRELDEAIHDLVNGEWLRENCVREPDGWRHPHFGKIAGAKSYTTSLDAAITLVPEGFKWGVGMRDRKAWGMPAGGPDVYWADVTGADYGNDTASLSPTLALCIVALQARKAAAT